MSCDLNAKSLFIFAFNILHIESGTMILKVPEHEKQLLYYLIGFFMLLIVFLFFVFS